MDGDLVAALGELSVAGLASRSGDFGIGAARFFNRDDAVVFAMEDPERDVFDFCGLAFRHAAADGNGGSKARGFVREPFESAVAAYGSTDQIKASGVDRLCREEVFEEGDDVGERFGRSWIEGMGGRGPGSGVGPHFAGRALWNENKAWVIFLVFRSGPDAGSKDSCAGEDLRLIIAAFAGAAMEDNHERKLSAGYFRSKPAEADGAVPVAEGAGFEALEIFPEKSFLGSFDVRESWLVFGGENDVGSGGGGRNEQEKAKEF